MLRCCAPCKRLLAAGQLSKLGSYSFPAPSKDTAREQRRGNGKRGGMPGGVHSRAVVPKLTASPGKHRSHHWIWAAYAFHHPSIRCRCAKITSRHRCTVCAGHDLPARHGQRIERQWPCTSSPCRSCSLAVLARPACWLASYLGQCGVHYLEKDTL
jgi:hypothetical protein